jgi:two-component system sensor histidine kinase KdpD
MFMRPGRQWQPYLLSLLLVAAITALGAAIRSLVLPSNIVMLYLLVVVIAAVRWGRGPSILAAILGGLAFDFFFIPPHLTLAVADTQYLLTFGALIAVGLVISTLAGEAREQAEAARHREMVAASLYALSRDLAAATGLDGILAALITHVSQTFACAAAVLLPEGRTLATPALSPGFVIDEAERAAAGYAFEHGVATGHGTEALASAGAHYLPLITARRVVGVLGVQPANPAAHLTTEQERLLGAFASQAAVAIEHVQLAEEARRAQLLQATEKLQTSLLNSISHDLRTPLASITGALSSLLDEEVQLDETTRHALIETAREDAEQLNRLVGNLLNMTRLQAGALHLAQEAADIQDLIGAALAQLAGRLVGRPVVIDVPADLPPVAIDFALMVQAVVNIIDNALKYSPSGTPIEILASAGESQIHIQVADRGVGIPAEDLERVFDKFYRVRRATNVTGTGLGLAISRGIVEAHGGAVSAENRSGGGTIIHIDLPLVGPLAASAAQTEAQAAVEAWR